MVQETSTNYPALCPLHGAGIKRDTCKLCNASYMRLYLRLRRLQSPGKALWERARRRAKQRGIEFSITKDAIVIPLACPALGITLRLGSQRTGNSPSLDRIIPTRGYVPGNVRVISDRANRLKGDRGLAELRLRACFGPLDLREDYALVAAYVDRELLLQEIRAKAGVPGRAGEEWIKIGTCLDRIFQRQMGRLAIIAEGSRKKRSN